MFEFHLGKWYSIEDEIFMGAEDVFYPKGTQLLTICWCEGVDGDEDCDNPDKDLIWGSIKI